MNIKAPIRSGLVNIVNSFHLSSEKIGTPKGEINTKDWCVKNNSFYQCLYPSVEFNNLPPLVLENDLHQLYKNELSIYHPEAFVATIEGGRVWGRNGAVITPDDLVLSDVSREFGRYGGVFGRDHSIFKQISLGRMRTIDATVAVIASAGAYNFHHWLYDNVARFHLLEKAGLTDQIDYYILDLMNLPFQKEVLNRLGVPEEKILICHDNWNFHVKCSKLIVPSLPSRLGVVNPWVVEYLRNLFGVRQKTTSGTRRVYISRIKANTRRLLNEAELMSFLRNYGFAEYLAEEHSVAETAEVFSESEFIVGVHGSGLSNLAFSPRGVKVIDIVSPNHLDPYYWNIANIRNGRYGYVFSEGRIDLKKTELVKKKVDEDLRVEMGKFEKLFYRMIK